MQFRNNNVLLNSLFCKSAFSDHPIVFAPLDLLVRGHGASDMEKRQALLVVWSTFFCLCLNACLSIWLVLSFILDADHHQPCTAPLHSTHHPLPTMDIANRQMTPTSIQIDDIHTATDKIGRKTII